MRIVLLMKSPLLYPKRSSIMFNDCSLNLNISDHVRFYVGKYDDRGEI